MSTWKVKIEMEILWLKIILGKINTLGFFGVFLTLYAVQQ